MALPSASLSPFFSLHIHPSILSPSAARRSPQLTLALPNPNFIHCLRSCRLSAETQDRLSLFPVSHSLSFTLFSLFFFFPPAQPPACLMRHKIARQKKSKASQSACGRYHRGNCYSSPSEKLEPSVHRGTFQ